MRTAEETIKELWNRLDSVSGLDTKAMLISLLGTLVIGAELEFSIKTAILTMPETSEREKLLKELFTLAAVK